MGWRQNNVLIYIVFVSDLYTEIISITTLPILKICVSRINTDDG